MHTTSIARAGRLAAIPLALAAPVWGATVSSLTLDRPIDLDGLELDGAGTLYVAEEWTGDELFAIDLATGEVTTVASGFQGPIDVLLGPDGTSLYSTNWTGTTVDVTDLSSGITEAYAAVGLRGDGLAWDDDGNLWVTQGWVGRIQRIAPDGTVTPIVTSGIGYPLGIAHAGGDVLYVGGAQDGTLYELRTDGTVTPVATVPGTGGFRLGHIAYGNGRVYASGIDDHVVYEILLDGTVEVLAGTGAAGGADGEASTATFNRPNGVALSTDGGTLYVAEIAHDTTVRIIDLGVVDVGDAAPAMSRPVTVTPNPFRGAAVISFTLDRDATVDAAVYTVGGRLVRTLSAGPRSRGRQGLAWDGRDDGGRARAPGVYFVRIDTDAGSHAERLILTR